MDEVDCIDVLASDEVANHTETPDVGPSTSLAPPVHTRCGLAPTSYLAIETPNPPLSTLHDTTGPPMPPIPPINTETPLWFTHAGSESSPHTTTVDHNSPTTPSYSSPQTVIPTPSPQTSQVELMSTNPSHDVSWVLIKKFKWFHNGVSLSWFLSTSQIPTTKPSMTEVQILQVITALILY